MVVEEIPEDLLSATDVGTIATSIRHDVPLDESVSEGVRDALGALAPLDREIVQLHHWDGFNLAEIAGILGRRPATIRSRYARARARLRQILSA